MSTVEGLPSLDALDTESARRHLKDFIRQSWHVVEPKTPFKANWHIDVICEHLEAVTRGELQRLCISIPPRHMKSLTVAVFWPAWSWIENPHLRWLFASYAQSLSTRDNIKRRNLLHSPWYKQRWDTFRLLSDMNTKSRFENDQTGYTLATSVGGSTTGEGGDIIVVDDAHKADEAQSAAWRQGVIDWWDETMSTRLNDPQTGSMVCVMQRLHEEDLIGHLMERGDWEYLCLPAEYEAKHPFVWPKDPRATENGGQGEGALLWPDHFPRVELDRLKSSLGAYAAAGQLQQRPAPAGGSIFKDDYFRYWAKDNGVYVLYSPMGNTTYGEAYCTVFATVDLAVTAKETSDYTVVSTWALTPNRDLLLLDRIRGRFEGPEQPQLIRDAYYRWQPRFIGIEAAGYQLSLIQQLIREGFPVQSIKPDKDKVSRALPVALRYEQGTVYHPRGVEWLGEWEDELLSFPMGSHDDQVDTVSFAGEMLPTIPVAQTKPARNRRQTTMMGNLMERQL